MKWAATILQNKKKFINALLNMFAFFAILHITLAVFLVILHSNLTFLNVFYIISISEFIPGIDQGGVSFAISLIIIASVYVFFYNRNRSK